MKQLTILVPEGQNNLSSIVGSFKLFTRANEYWQSLGNQPLFKVSLAGTLKEVKLYDGLFAIYPQDIDSIGYSDLIIIPSINKDYRNSIARNQRLIDWIARCHKQGSEIASICTGAFLLAASGIIDNKDCSTHWIAADDFRTMFPKVNAVPNKIITDEHGIYTNGGAYSFLNLILYLVGKFYNRQTAIYCSKVFQIDIERDSQSAFTIFSGQKTHGDNLIKEAQELIEHNLEEKITFEEMAARLSVSRRNFDRRFIKATGNTPVEYLQRVKIEIAKRNFETSRKNINEVMYDAGYTDIKAFRTIFKKLTGLSPLEYRQKYNKEFPAR